MASPTSKQTEALGNIKHPLFPHLLRVNHSGDTPPDWININKVLHMKVYATYIDLITQTMDDNLLVKRQHNPDWYILFADETD